MKRGGEVDLTLLTVDWELFAFHAKNGQIKSRHDVQKTVSTPGEGDAIQNIFTEYLIRRKGHVEGLQRISQ
ncbi:MAG TPA: hypothetical protein PLX02_09845 [Syntrophorhabdaceae bacterium]|nr:hypothetical protein [Syntrophorhabdaceae bacterium]HQM81909.1 hypothetical protein [Syntrophorhabdaceae bacterium]